MADEIKVDIESASSIGHKRQNTENGGPASKRANVSDSDTVQIKVLIPSGAVGALIGKGGETMRNLKNDTGCRVQMSKNQEVYHGTTERICLIKGKVLSAMAVLRVVLEKIQEKIDSNQPSDLFDLKGMDRSKEMKFVVPNTSAGMVIGKSGSSIKEIREITTANIQIYPKAGSEEAKVSAERVITVGHESNDVILAASQRVIEKVAQDPMHAHPTEVTSKQEPQQTSFDLTRVGGTSGTQFSNSQPVGNVSVTNWQPPNTFDPNFNKNYAPPTLKFNPLQGTSNNDLLNFLDNLQATLRTSGFNDNSVSEVMQAMQVLAKYNIMGLGLGLGVAAMAQMRTSESQAVAQQNALLAAAQQTAPPAPQPTQRYDLGGHPALLGSGAALLDASDQLNILLQS